MVFGGESEGVVGGEGVVRDSGGRDRTRNDTEWGVVIVCSNAIAGFKVDEFRDVFVSIKGVEELVASGIGKHKEWARGHGFGWLPDKES